MSLRRICDVVVRRNARLQGILVKRLATTETTEKKDEIVDITTAADEQPVYSSADINPEVQAEIARKRNKSRLNPEHRNILMGMRPYDSSQDWYHETVRYKKRMMGRYGLPGDEPVGFAWPKPEEVEDAREYERVAFPLSLQERWKKLEEEKQRKAEEIRIREKEVEERLAKMDHWTAKLQEKIAKKEADLEAAKREKDRLVEEVRRHFGFKISPHDERFKEMLAQKEKEEKKKKKAAKKQAKLNRLMQLVTPMKLESKDQEADSTKDST